jgi:PIN domain nuclease of toxin-antitoxin system
MKLLLDTQCWLWMLASPERFAPEARAMIDDDQAELLLSAASAWEIAVKHAHGKLRLPEPPARFVPSRLEATRVRSIAIDLAHALHAAQLPPHHRDPFDRVLIAQARVERLPILTADPIFDRYDVETIRA